MQRKTSLAIISGLAAACALTLPARADLWSYVITGELLANVGPSGGLDATANTKGSFRLFAQYDDSINYTVDTADYGVTNYTGGWTRLRVEFYEGIVSQQSPVNFQYRMDTAFADSFCFKSPGGKNNTADGNYVVGLTSTDLQTAVGDRFSSACGGPAPLFATGDTQATPQTVPTFDPISGQLQFISLGSTNDYRYGPPPNNSNTCTTGDLSEFCATVTYFRMPFLGTPSYDDDNIAANVFRPAIYTNGDNQWGWNALAAAPNNPNLFNGTYTRDTVPTAGSSPYLRGTCIGSNNAVPDLNQCPYSGNQQANSNISPGTVQVNRFEIPAPLPAAGILPLGFTLKRLAKKRKKLLALSHV